jgi:hypothetical protein
MDKFPEAFSRFEEVVNIDEMGNIYQLQSAFSQWAGHRWKGSSKQKYALAREAEKHDITVPLSYFRMPHKERGWRVSEGFVTTDSFTRRGREVYVLRDVKTGRFVSGKTDSSKAIGDMGLNYNAG